MIFSRLILDSRHPGSTSMYDVHQLLWKLFADDPNRKRDFLFREMNPGHFMALSERTPEDKDGLWNIESKFFEPKLMVGDRLRFSLRANAVVKTKNDQGRQQRHDVVQYTRTKLKEQGMAEGELPSSAQLAQEQGCAWFVKRQESFGVLLEESSFLAQSYSQQSFYKKESGRGRISYIDMQGLISVQDPALFLKKINNGIGPAKSFGCGLMLIKRA